MAKLVNIFADDIVRELAISMVHQNEMERERTAAKIRDRLHLISHPAERLREFSEKDLARRRAAMANRPRKSD